MDKMEQIYACVRDRDRSKNALLATVTEGAAAGEKAYVEDGTIQIQKGTFFTGENEKNLQGKGLMKINGQEVFLQPLGNQSKLIICGGGHVSQALVKMAGLLDFEITVLEDRPLFAETAKREGADQVFCGDYRELLQQIPDSSDNYFVCMTRGHRFDRDCLLEILKKPHAYVGMMGSRKRSFLMKKYLVQEGFSEELAESLHAKETALDEQVLEILSRTPEPGEQRMLCTIIEKHGSAPRSAGTQMVVTSMNQITGTIGGGCAEAEVITVCREHFYKLREKIPHAACEKRQIRMSTDNAEEEGMVCGGTIVVLLEEI